MAEYREQTGKIGVNRIQDHNATAMQECHELTNTPVGHSEFEYLHDVVYSQGSIIRTTFEKNNYYVINGTKVV